MAIQSRRGRVSRVRWYSSGREDKEGKQKVSLKASDQRPRFFLAGEEEISLFMFTWYVFLLSHLQSGC